MIEAKACVACKKLKLLDCFKFIEAKNRFTSRCVPCLAYQRANDRKRRHGKKQKRYYTKGANLRELNLRNKYGITQQIYEEILAAQNGVCAICKTSTPSSHRKAFYIDHCHVTGIIRGLLCNSCNRRLRLIGDTYEAALKYLEYLKRNRAQHEQTFISKVRSARTGNKWVGVAPGS